MKHRTRREPGWPRRHLVAAAVVVLAGGVAVAQLEQSPGRPPPSRPPVAEAAPAASPSGSAGHGFPTLPPAAEASADPATTPPATPTPAPSAQGPTLPPIAVPTTRVATRVTVPELGIDLPVMRQNTPYPACDVAMYILELSQPGRGGVTYLYAHAQSGNFLPLLRESLVNDGARMLGMAVDVYTGDSLRFTYRISEVRRHVTGMDGAFSWRGSESVWLQTSEGQVASAPKLQVVATYVSTAATDDVSAHPVPRPTTC